MMKNSSNLMSGGSDYIDLENRVILNVGGTRFETYKTILKKIPATRLSRLTEALVNYDPVTNEYFLDRHPGVFTQILNYYRTGKLHYPNNVCGPLFEEELEFWGLDYNQVEPCCWKTYTKHRDTEETLSTLDRLNIDVERTSREDLIIKFGLDRHGGRDKRLGFFRRLQPIIWQLFEEPRSSRPAMIIGCIQISMIIISVAVLWTSSYSISRYQILKMDNQLLNSSDYQEDKRVTSFRLIDDDVSSLLVIVDYITAAWFIVDIVVRFVVSPSKREHIHNFDNLVDLIATLWLLIDLNVLRLFVNSVFQESLQVVRVLRLFRLLTYHPGLQVIITSIKKSAEVLQLLVFFMIVSSTIYGALIFYSERLTTDDPNKNLFISIPDAVWYSLVSLTTIGYGDLSPTTVLGRLFGSACVVTGVLMIGLPMTIVVEIFTNFYNHLRARSKLPKQRRRIQAVEAPRLRKQTNAAPVPAVHRLE
jgi:potassium voltage-gated channel Shaw-related subfamily C protein 1